MNTQYWLVGATYGDEGDQSEWFVAGGYWMLGWREGDSPEQAERCKQIKPGDRIAIKKLQGRGATQITIRHIGVVKGIIPCDYSLGRFVCTVNWLNSEDMDRSVKFFDFMCGGSIAGPYAYGVDNKTDQWLESVFRI